MAALLTAIHKYSTCPGPGGTGKSTVLLLVEALIDHFAGAGAVQKCAISNTAARLLGGDTLHAVCKLPRLDLQERRGQLSPAVLKQLRGKWRQTEAVFIDEISMVAPEQLLQTDVRVRQAKLQDGRRFGGVGICFSGDFLQLPPVQTHSLAEKVDDVGHWTDLRESDDLPEERAGAETRQGIDLWHAVTNVVTLTVPMRAPGVLSRLLGEMRAGKISPDMWNMYLDRVLKPDDERLVLPPFSNHPINYIVHRHSIRNMQSFKNAKRESRRLGVRLYMVAAADAVRDADSALFTDAAREEMLRRVSPRFTQHLPSHLPLYVGMRLLLYSKACVRFGLMNGCECELAGIVTADDEELPKEALAGEYICLKYMPASLLLRVPKAPWILPTRELPSIPSGVSRRGLFQLQPTTKYLRYLVEKNTYISVRRTQFPVLPADTRIVYAAQGETFDAVVADMERPPRMDKATHWLACYVMLSRARDVQGLLVLRPAAYDDISAAPPSFLAAEMDRLAQLETESTGSLLRYLRSLPWTMPSVIESLFDKDLTAKEAARVEAVRQHGGAYAVRSTDHGQPGSVSQSFSTASKRRRLCGKQPPRTENSAPASSAAVLQPDTQGASQSSAPAALDPDAPATTRVAPSVSSAAGTPPVHQFVASSPSPADTRSDSQATGAPSSSSSALMPQSVPLSAPRLRAAVGSAEASGSGCDRCGRPFCHPDSPHCPFYGREREQHVDATQRDGSVRHVFQRKVVKTDERTIEIDDRPFTLGYASGVDNNCLIDSLRQAVNVIADVDEVR